MPDVPELSQGAANGRATPTGLPTVDAEPEAPQVVEARTAILIYTTPDGQVVLTPDLNVPVSVERIATPDEAYGMLAVSMKDIHVQEAAALTAPQAAQAIVAFGQRQMQAMQNKAIEEQLNKQGGLRRQ